MPLRKRSLSVVQRCRSGSPKSLLFIKHSIVYRYELVVYQYLCFAISSASSTNAHYRPLRQTVNQSTAWPIEILTFVHCFINSILPFIFLCTFRVDFKGTEEGTPGVLLAGVSNTGVVCLPAIVSALAHIGSGHS